jgi:hypothetical protein
VAAPAPAAVAAVGTTRSATLVPAVAPWRNPVAATQASAVAED